MLQVRSMKNMKSAESCSINLYPHIKALNTAVRVTLNSIRSFFSNSISQFDFLTLYVTVSVCHCEDSGDDIGQNERKLSGSCSASYHGKRRHASINCERPP